MIDKKLSISIAELKLKSIVHNGNAIKLIINSTIIRYAINTGTLTIYDPNRFYRLINQLNLNRIRYLDFTIYKRKNI